MSKKKRILVAPLNWGLGHATRSIPIITELLRQDVEVILASDGNSMELLIKEFPQLIALPLPGYNVRYYTRSMVFNMGMQIPKIIGAALGEYRMTQKFIRQYGIDGIISDSRFGCRSHRVKSIIISHQLNIQSYPERKFAISEHLYNLSNRLVNHFNKKVLSAFDACWVPDWEDEPNLSGNLSHNVKGKSWSEGEIKYIGALTRMKYVRRKKVYDVIVVLSGPEPQRTIFENLIIKQALTLSNFRFLIVQGKSGAVQKSKYGENIDMVSVLSSADLNQAIMSSEVYIGRSGYSTIMDLTALKKPALLIPTPGQTEQQYLADKFYTEGIFLLQAQETLDLKEALANLPRFPGFGTRYDMPNRLQTVVREYLDSLPRRK